MKPCKGMENDKGRVFLYRVVKNDLSEEVGLLNKDPNKVGELTMQKSSTKQREQLVQGLEAETRTPPHPQKKPRRPVCLEICKLSRMSWSKLKLGASREIHYTLCSHDHSFKATHCTSHNPTLLCH